MDDKDLGLKEFLKRQEKESKGKKLLTTKSSKVVSVPEITKTLEIKPYNTKVGKILADALNTPGMVDDIESGVEGELSGIDISVELNVQEVSLVVNNIIADRELFKETIINII